MSDQNQNAAPQDQTLDTLKYAVLAQMHPDDVFGEGKVGVAFNFDEFKATLAQVDAAVEPYRGIINSLPPNMFTAAVQSIVAALKGADAIVNRPANANAPVGASVI